jgi:MobA-like NTP transferase domain
MAGWTAIAFAPALPGAGGLGSRLSKYLHPLAGRPLAWHTLQAVSALSPAPDGLLVVGPPELTPDVFHDLPLAVRAAADEDADPAGAVRRELTSGAPVLAFDAAALALPAALQALVDGPAGTLLHDPRGRALAAWLTPGQARAFAEGGADFAALPELFPAGARLLDPEGFVVESRAELARASVRVRDRLVRALMEGGATFLLPETVLVDVDVRLGRDTVVYPNVVLEGQTTVGDETVIGPGCRIVDSWIGSGVELKGHNYVSHTSIRNRAILEPHVRRGFD